MYTGTKRSPVNVILLSIVTCGIYGIWWLYNAGKEINQALGREAVNPIFAVVSIICFPILFYYVYTLDQDLTELSGQRGVPYSSNFVLWVITMLFGIGTLIVMIQTQTTLNSIWEKSAN